MRLLFYYGICCVIFNVIKGGQGVVMIGQETFVECSSHAEITFKRISPVENASFVIAECDEMIRTCRMLVQGLENTYNISYTGRGGILHIKHVGKDTYGTYECFETYFPINYATVEINPRYIDGEDENITRCEDNGKKEMNHTPIIVLSIVAIVVPVVILVIMYVYRTKVTQMAGSYGRTMKRRLCFGSTNMGSEDIDQIGRLQVNTDSVDIMCSAIGETQSYTFEHKETKDICLKEMVSKIRALCQDIEKADKAQHDLITREEHIYLGDSNQTLANVKTAVEEIKKQLKRVYEELKTCRRARATNQSSTTI